MLYYEQLTSCSMDINIYIFVYILYFRSTMIDDEQMQNKTPHIQISLFTCIQLKMFLTGIFVIGLQRGYRFSADWGTDGEPPLTSLTLQ